jgi:lipopolysaccharide export system protein LptA
MKRRRFPELACLAGLALALPALGQQPADAVANAAPASPTSTPVAATPAATAPAEPAPSKSEATREQLTRLPSAADMRPTGPMTVTANRAEVIQGSTAVYTGDVHFDSNTLKLDGERLEVKRAADGQYEAKMTGAPAHMFHAGVEPDNPEVTAHAKTMTYDSRSGIINLIGEALATRGKDEIHGETIRYNVADRSMDVDGGKGRVVIRFEAPPPTPAPTAPAATPPAPAATTPAPTPASSTPPAEAPKP